ncbi:MAG: DEAD/DEAH box helicase family protein [Atopobiaceae bacterium]|nr:DEAD/DEAH box helicase family protein [Atopobiaceae bacterium]
MELKNYQQRVLKNLRSFVMRYAACGDARQAYHEYLMADGISDTGGNRMYHDVLGVNGDGKVVPKVCIKVPTGGGKTFIATNAVSVIMDELPDSLNDVVVWLVPRMEILRQTLNKLRNPDDPLRIVLDRDFGHRVEVLEKESGLRGVSFNSTTIDDQLTVFVLSYDSFKKNKDGRRAYQENSALMQLTSYQRAAGTAVSVEGADDTALITALASTNPIIIVDESHHARSDLSVQMLKNLNPRFVLELTATPDDSANIISRVTARELKDEQMVKLPVIVYRRSNKVDVIQDAVMLQRRLEQVAQDAEANDGRYIRPIVLFQAEPRGNEGSETYQRLRDKLVGAGIPEEQVAIRTGDVDELGSTDLLSRSCPIRYIITVEALSEGWDCPFAYVLATVANKSSKMSVEQIVGRILRQPYANRSEVRCLNISYVLTSAPDLNTTIEQVIAGLNGSGYSKADVRAAKQYDRLEHMEQQTLFQGSDSDEGIDDDFELLFPDVESGTHQDERPECEDNRIEDIIDEAEAAERDYTSNDEGEEDKSGNDTGLGDDMDGYRIRESVASTVEELVLPRFVTREDAGLFSLIEYEGGYSTFDWHLLLEDFDLSACGTDGIAFDYTGYDRARLVDLDDESDDLKVRGLNNDLTAYMRDVFARHSPERKRKDVVEGIYGRLPSKFTHTYGSMKLYEYIARVVGQMSSEQVDAYIDNAGSYTQIVMSAVRRKSREHCRARFAEKLDSERIRLCDTYRFPIRFHTGRPLRMYDRTLYEAEDANMNGLERRMAETLANCAGIRWWHRIVERRDGEFCINGFINHYPDFVAMTNGGRIYVVETKGDDKHNPDSIQKLELGRKWAGLAGQKYHYFMVFENNPLDMEGAYSFAGFKAKILNQL